MKNPFEESNQKLIAPHLESVSVFYIIHLNLIYCYVRIRSTKYLYSKGWMNLTQNMTEFCFRIHLKSSLKEKFVASKILWHILTGEYKIYILRLKQIRIFSYCDSCFLKLIQMYCI